jgi:predicted DNA-binding transcriptional regulator YafY
MNIEFDYNGKKSFRLLFMYERLNKGELLCKSQLVNNFGVTPKTVQRDIDDLRAYLSETHQYEPEVAIKYDKSRKGYYLVKFEREWMTNEEVLVLCKILLESRAFDKSELKNLINKLVIQAVSRDQKVVSDMISSEYKYYVPPRHGKKLLSLIWEISERIYSNEIISFEYMRLDRTKRSHQVKPVSIMFSEFYFYLISYMNDDSKEYPTVFRIDRIENIKNHKKQFITLNDNKFNEGEFRKRVQFMYSGELKLVKFEFTGPNLEAVFDKLPTAQVISEKEGVSTISVETYGDGILMWIRSQGEWARLLE